MVATSRNAAQAPDDFRGMRADTLLVELPFLQSETPQAIQRLARQLGAQRIVVEYSFASGQLEQDLRALGCHLVRAPLNVDDLNTLCGAMRTVFTG